MSPLPTLRQLRYLTALAEHHHFGHAAEACFVTQSTLSSGLQELENLLGAVLVERTKRRVLLTPLGETVVERATRLLRDAEDIVEMVHAAAAQPLTGPLRLGVIPTIAPYLLPALLPPLRHSFPDLKLYLREDLTARLLEHLAGGRLDVALLALPYEADGITTVALAEDPFLLACAADHPLAAKTEIAPADLEATELLLLEEGHCLREHAMAACRLSGAKAGEAVRGTSLHTVIQMVASGLGVTLLPRLAVEAGAIEGTGLVVRPLAGHAPARILALAWRRSSPRDAEYRRLADFIGQLRAGREGASP